MSESVRRWSKSTKRTVTLVLLLLLALVIYRFRAVLPPLMIAFLMAFILDPIVDFLSDRLGLSRGLATTLVFLVLALVMVGVVAAPVSVVPSIPRVVRATQSDVIRIITDIGAFFERPVEIWGYSLDLSAVYRDLSTMLRSFVTSVAQGTLDVVVDIASGAFWLIVILIAAYYLTKDGDRIVEQLEDMAPPGYRDDFVRLRRRITDVWNAFLRGQLLLGVVLAVITTVVCTAVGLPYAVGMGLIAGVMEFVPNLGPIIALIPAVLMALFQGSSYLPLSNFWFAVLVTGLYVVIQQIEGNLLVPRILGRSLNLHPLVVLIGIIVGGNLAGILGMLLAAPVLATLRVVSRYIFYRLYDRDPFAEPEVTVQPPRPGLLKRAGEVALERLQEEIEQRREETEHAEQAEEAEQEEQKTEPNAEPLDSAGAGGG
jgi:predicted PurR-regulated permease PerM